MEIVEDYRYFVRYEVESWLDLDADEEAYATKIYGTVLYQEDDDDDEGVPCGYIRVTHLRCAEMMANDEFDPRGWAAADSDEMGEIARAIYRKDGRWTSAIEKQWGDIDVFDLLVINEIELKPEYRGRGLGLQVASRTLDLFGNPCGITALCPWPTEVRGDGETATRRAHHKLAKYSERLGFKRVGGSEVWARSLVHEIDREEN